MKHIVVDLEMNPVSRKYEKERMVCGREIIEIGAVILDEQYHEIGSFKTLVKPQYNDIIEPYFVRLTKITTEMVSNAPVFEEALKMFFSWCRSVNDQVCIYQWSESDFEQIVSEMQLKKVILEEENKILLSSWIDFQREYGQKLNLSRAISLKNATMYAGIDFEGNEHDALDDAYMTMKVFHLFKRQITKNKFKIQKPNKKNNKPID